MDDLTMEVRDLDLIRVGDPDKPDTRGGKVQSDGRTKSPCPQEQDLGFAETQLTGLPYPGQTNLPGVQGLLMVA